MNQPDKKNYIKWNLLLVISIISILSFLFYLDTPPQFKTSDDIFNSIFDNELFYLSLFGSFIFLFIPSTIMLFAHKHLYLNIGKKIFKKLAGVAIKSSVVYLGIIYGLMWVDQLLYRHDQNYLLFGLPFIIIFLSILFIIYSQILACFIFFSYSNEKLKYLIHKTAEWINIIRISILILSIFMFTITIFLIFSAS